jgi:hypothetical protein
MEASAQHPIPTRHLNGLEVGWLGFVRQAYSCYGQTNAHHLHAHDTADAAPR